MDRNALPTIAACALVVTVAAGLILTGYAPRPGDGGLLVAFDAGSVFGVLGCAAWRWR